MLPSKYSFKLLSKKTIRNLRESKTTTSRTTPADAELLNSDHNKRNFLRIAGIAGAGLVASQLFPKRASALIMGSTPSSNVVGLKNSSNTRINPATEETLSSLLVGNGVTKLTINLGASGTIRTPSGSNKIRLYACRFSLTADTTSVAFQYTSGGTPFEKYVSPKAGGLYGSNNHPNYYQGGAGEDLYCVITGTTGTIQINIDYLEIA